MATRSTISVLNSDNSVSTVYCHWDGYLRHNGSLLLRHYNNENLARELVARGDVELLGDSVVTTSYLSTHSKTPTVHTSLRSESYHKCRQEYNYVYCSDAWYVSQFDEELTLLSNELLDVQ